jgi:hypothetical protein
MQNNSMIWWLIAMFAFVLLLGIGSKLTRQSRTQRRLRKTHGRIISRSQRPSVQLSVKSPKRK